MRPDEIAQEILGYVTKRETDPNRMRLGLGLALANFNAGLFIMARNRTEYEAAMKMASDTIAKLHESLNKDAEKWRQLNKEKML